MTKNGTIFWTAALVTLMAMLSTAPFVRGDIFQWEYVDPGNPALGKQPSVTLVPDGAGAIAVQGTNLANRDLTKAYLIGADLSAFNVIDEGHWLYSINSDLTAVNLSQADLTNAKFDAAKLVGANFAGAEVRGARFRQEFSTPGSGLTLAQLYSTASYAAHDLSAIHLGGNLVGANFAMQNLAGASLGPDLTDANFGQTNLRGASLNGTLTGANLSGAEVREADFNRYGYPRGGLTLAQLYSTASYQAHDLSGIVLAFNDLTGGNFSGQNLAHANFQGAYLVQADLSHANLSGVRFADFYNHPEFPEAYLADLTDANLSNANLTNAIWFGYATLAGVNLTGADARGAQVFDPLPATATVANLIGSNGRIAGLALTAGGSLTVRDYDGNPAASPPTGPLPIVIEQQLAIDSTGALRLEFDADPWGSTISFAPGIPVALGGALELSFAPGVDPAAQLGRTIDLFDWAGVTPAGAFNVASPYSWDLTKLYTTGEVTLTTVAGLVLGDFNGDSVVDASDLAQWKGDFGLNDESDADLDGDSDGADFLAWQRQLGQGAPAVTTTAPVPEPASAVTFALGIMLVTTSRAGALVRRGR